MLIAQNPSSEHQEASRKKMEFISLLLTSRLLSPAPLQERHVSLCLLRRAWPEVIILPLLCFLL